MFDVGFSELVLMAIVALVVLGPEKLPHAARVAGAWVARIKRTVGNMQAEIEREVSAQEMRERLQKEIQAVRDAGNGLAINQEFQAVQTDMRNLDNEIRSSLTPATDIGTPLGTPGTETAPAVLPPVAESAPLPALADGLQAAEPVAPVAAPPGEAAYREWLAAQKNANLRPVATSSAPESPADSSSS